MKLCLVFTDNFKANILTTCGCKYYLASYLYVCGAEKAYRKVVQHKEFLIIDSGAHTFQQEGKETDYDRFVFEYAKWVRERLHEIDEYVELDIENKVGLRQVEKWREYMTKVVGKPPIVVWHPERGKDYWLYMVKTYPYDDESF